MPLTYIPSLLDFYHWSKVYAALELSVSGASTASSPQKIYQQKFYDAFAEGDWVTIFELQESSFIKATLEEFIAHLNFTKIMAAFLQLQGAVAESTALPLAEKYLLMRILSEVSCKLSLFATDLGSKLDLREGTLSAHTWRIVKSSGKAGSTLENTG